MKTKIFTFMTLAVFSAVSAQTEQQSNKDTTSVNRQISKEPDPKTLDAVKVTERESAATKPKHASKTKDTTTKDTTRVKKNTRGK